jgi:hypothetical protein
MSKIHRGKIRIAQNCRKAAPENLLGRAYKQDELVPIIVWGWPGRPHQNGTVAWHTSATHTHEHWSFWTGTDIDLSLIFTAEDITELFICPELAEQIGGTPAPFTITIDPALSPPKPEQPEFEIGQEVKIEPLHKGNWSLPKHMRLIRGAVTDRRYNEGWQEWSYKIQMGEAYMWLSNQHLRTAYESQLVAAK